MDAPPPLVSRGDHYNPAMLPWFIAAAAAYVVGSIPFGYMIGRMKGIDIRQHGSKNVGATNVTRVLGRPLGLTCFALDVVKGAAPVAIAGAILGMLGRPLVTMTGDGALVGESAITAGEMGLWLLVAAAAIAGHMYSVFLGFKGGKGVATGFGAMLGMWPLLTYPALGALAVWVATVMASRYVSLASMTAACLLPLLTALSAWLMSGRSEGITRAWPLILVTILLAVLVVWKHRGNIERLRDGTEPKIGRRLAQAGGSAGNRG